MCESGPGRLWLAAGSAEFAADGPFGAQSTRRTGRESGYFHRYQHVHQYQHEFHAVPFADLAIAIYAVVWQQSHACLPWRVVRLEFAEHFRAACFGAQRVARRIWLVGPCFRRR